MEALLTVFGIFLFLGYFLFSVESIFKKIPLKSLHFDNVLFLLSHLMDTLVELKILDWKIVFPQTIEDIAPWSASILLMRNLMLMWFLFFLAESFFLSVNFYDCVLMVGVLKCHNNALDIEGCFSSIPSEASYWVAACPVLFPIIPGESHSQHGILLIIAIGSVMVLLTYMYQIEWSLGWWMVGRR